MFSYDHEIQLFISRMYPIEQPYRLSIEEQNIVNEKSNFYNQIVDPFSLESGEEVSLKERESMTEVSDITLTYGEIDFFSMADVYYTIKNRYGGFPNGIFYDLGSGMGKCVIASALLMNFDKCKGIEILKGLYEFSLKINQKFHEDFPGILEKNKHLWDNFTEIEFIQGDMFEYN